MSPVSWISDSAEGGSVVENGNEVSVSAARQGTPFNVRSKTPASDFFYFAVEIRELTGSVSVGLVTPGEFQPGWKTRGMFYNGNVTNGSGALITGFGKYVTVGDTVGVRKVNNDTATEVQFLVNQKCLGTAFSLENATSKTFCPCVHVSGNVKFVYREIATSFADFVLNDSTAESEEAATGYEGDWKLRTLNMNGAAVVLPSNHPVVLSIHGAPNPTKICAKVANTMSGSVQIIGDSLGESGALDVRIGSMTSTRMMPPPELQALERAVSQAIPMITKMSLAMGHLYMSGPGLGGPELTASRYTKTFEPLSKY